MPRTRRDVARDDKVEPEVGNAGGVDWLRRAVPWSAVALVPLAVAAVLRVRPSLDARWENHPAHFWLVLAAAGVAFALGAAVSVAARRRLDARLFLVSLGFVAAAGFLGLHALATPGVLLGPNAGFELATPVGLLLGGAFVAVSAVELTPPAARLVIARSRPLLGALAALIIVWGALSLGEVPPLDAPLQREQLDGWQTVLAAVGVALYAAGALGYFRLYQRRRSQFVLSVTTAFALLAAAMVVIALAVNWRISWWEWHVLMLGAFVLMAAAARQEGHEERFGALYLDHTLAGVREASILFADLEGYTSYSERNDPAVVAQMLNAYFGRLVPLMREIGGDVHQLIGDAVMVVFNKAGDQPDHAVLAAHAALALQREAAAIASREPSWPRFRVGVNSGEVLAGVVGGRGHRKHDLVGDTVNLAARLESVAPVGEVVVGEGTLERLPRETTAEPLAPTRVKGKHDPVRAYILRGLPDR